MIKELLCSDRHMSRLNDEEKSRLAFFQRGKPTASQRYSFVWLVYCFYIILYYIIVECLQILV